MHALRDGLFRLWDGEVGRYFRAIFPSLPSHVRQNLWAYSLLRVNSTPEGSLLREFTLDFLPDLHSCRGHNFLAMITYLSWTQKDADWTPEYFHKIEAAYGRWVDGLAGDKQSVRERKLPFFEGLRAMCHHANEWWIIRASTEMLYVWARVMRRVMPPRTPPNTSVNH